MDKDALNIVNAYYEKMYGTDVVKVFVKVSSIDFSPQIHYSFLGECYNTHISLESIEDMKLAHGVNFGAREIIQLIDCDITATAEYKPEIKRMLDLYKFRKHST